MSILIGEITSFLEEIAPLNLQEHYDNCGLITGSKSTLATGVLISLDVTENIVDEAISNKCNLVISHHPLVFSGIKKLNGKNWVERTLIKAIKNDIAVYALHTNFDNLLEGVNGMMAQKIDLSNIQVLLPKKDILKKLVCFAPASNALELRKALFDAGAGNIGNYDNCSFNTEGIGTFKANENANPYVGKKGLIHSEPEIKIETIFPSWKEHNIIAALLKSHPYEEVAYDIFPLHNTWNKIGAGLLGELKEPLGENEFLALIKEKFNCDCIRHTQFLGRKIKKVALCGGSGSFLLQDAIAHNADVFITADFKYHQFFDADNQILVLDVGHYESEQFTVELIFQKLQKKFSNFALCLSKNSTNPVYYY